MTAVQLAPLAASPLPHRTDWQGMRDAIELFILERRADKTQPSTIRYYRQQLGSILQLADAAGRARRRP